MNTKKIIDAANLFESLARAAKVMQGWSPRSRRFLAGVIEKKTGVNLLALGIFDDEPVRRRTKVSPPPEVDEFMQAWESGNLPVPFLACRARDLYRSYWHWSRDRGGYPTSEAAFLYRAERLPCVRKKLARIRDDRIKAQCSILIPVDTRISFGSMELFLTDAAGRFRLAVDEYEKKCGTA